MISTLKLNIDAESGGGHASFQILSPRTHSYGALVAGAAAAPLFSFLVCVVGAESRIARRRS